VTRANESQPENPAASAETSQNDGLQTHGAGEPHRKSQGYSRGRHRARNHDSAHPHGAADDHNPVPNHPLIPAATHELVTTQAGLTDLLDHLRASRQFAYDSEFIGEMSYHPQLCLIQVASSRKVTLIDPMASIDLMPFWELLCDPSVVKIVHAGEQDMEPVVRHLGRRPANFLDTQIAAGFVGMAYPVSLSKLVLELTGAKLGKGLTFTDWSQRPLSAVQLRYAADDVRYLPAIAASLEQRLDARGHLAWAKEESESLGDPARFQFDADSDYLRVRGASGLPPQGLAILRELAAWRDAAAQRADAPPRAYLKDEILMDMARSPIKSVEKLARVRGLPRPVESEHGHAIVDATMRGLSAPLSSLPTKASEPTPTQRFGADSLWATVQVLCAGRGIDPNLVTSRQEIGDFYRHLIAGTAPSTLRLMKGWRAKAVGHPLAEMYEGKITLESNWQDGRLIGAIANSSR
jgi:ribonuclease D